MFIFFLLSPVFWLQSNKSRDHRYPVLFKTVQSHPRVPCRLFRDAQAPSAKQCMLLCALKIISCSFAVLGKTSVQRDVILCCS